MVLGGFRLWESPFSALLKWTTICPKRAFQNCVQEGYHKPLDEEFYDSGFEYEQQTFLAYWLSNMVRFQQSCDRKTSFAEKDVDGIIAKEQLMIISSS